ncbi:MAG: dephospho-CoA kinase [Alphaproteobacteria bacterium]
MITVAITGSVGMGKSTVAGFFAQMGAALFDADAVVHKLYQRGGAAVKPIAAAFGDCVVDGAVDREALAGAVFGDADALRRLENIVHPLVAVERAQFVEASARAGKALAVAEIPLLFETGAEKQVDVVVVVSAPVQVQRQRVLARPGMTQERFQAILDRQMPDAQKRRRADYVILTDETLEATRAQVAKVVNDITPRV